MKKSLGIVIVLMLLFTCTIPMIKTQNLSILKNKSESLEFLFTKVTIYVNTSAIDGRSDLNQSQKDDLKNRILQHIRDNYEPVVGAGNVSVTNDPSQAGSADRTVQIQPGRDPNPPPSWGSWPHQSNTTNVFLGEFMNNSNVNGSFKNPDGSWNVTALGNAIGHTSGHEIGHSYSIGHNNESRPKTFAQDNRSKMTVGTNINASERANAAFGFDQHSRDVLGANWGKGACDSAPDYDAMILGADFYANPPSPDLDDEHNTFDALFHCFVSMPGWYELGFLGVDSDHGLIDGNPEFDFIYKSSLWMNEIDAQFISFLSGHQERTTWLIRGTEMSPFPGEWFYLNPANVFLEELILQPDGDEVFRMVTMVWPEHMVNVMLESFSHENAKQMFNGFTYRLYVQSPPDAPNITGATSGKKGKSYEYTLKTFDLQGDKVYYFIDWGDNTTKDWFGPYYHDEEVKVSHTWSKKGTYIISAKAKDYYGHEGPLGYLEVKMPRTISSNQLFTRLLKLFPNAYSILRYLIDK